MAAAYTDAVLALSGLVAYWPMTDVAGSLTGVDLGPNALTLTYAQAKVDATEQVTGLGAGMLGDGTTRKASRAVGVGSPLRLTTAVSIGQWYTPTTTPASGNRVIAGRSGNWFLRHNSSGGTVFSPTLSGGTGTASSVTGTTILTNGEAYLVGGSYDGFEMAVWVNGAPDSMALRVGATLPTTTDAMEILAGAGAFANGAVSGVFVVNRALTTGEWRALYLAGTKLTPPDEGRFYANTLPTLLVDASAANPAGCAACGGAMRAAEPKVNTGAAHGRGIYHPGCYGTRQAAKAPIVVSGTSTATQIGTEAARFLHDTILTYVRRPTASKLRYWDGALGEFILADSATVEWSICTPGIATGCAILHRTAGTPANHWTVTLAKAAVEQMLLQQQSYGRFGTAATPDSTFVMMELLPTLLYLRDVLDKATIVRWTAAAVACGNFFVAGGGGYTSEALWYSNGNLEVMEACIYWLLYRLTGEAAWLAQYETQLVWAQTPLGTAETGSVGHGLVISLAPTLTDGSDGRAYFTEKGSALPGYDPGYTITQLNALVRLYSWNADVRILKLINMLHNQLMLRVNTTTWVIDATGGTRGSFSALYGSPAVPMLSWGGLRTDITSTWPGAQWITGADPDFRSQRGFSTAASFRGLAEILGQWVISSPLWPGMPS